MSRTSVVICLLLFAILLCLGIDTANEAASPPSSSLHQRVLSFTDEMEEAVNSEEEEEEAGDGEGNNGVEVGMGGIGARSDKKVAIFGVHFEGNLGDLMETTPLVERLHEWGVEIDCYLSMFRGGMGKIDKKIKRGVGRYCNNFFTEKTRRSEVSQRNYDAVIIAPGPTVDHFKYCFDDFRAPGHNISMVWFGVSVASRDQLTFERQQSCLRLITIRESYSYSMVRGWRAELAKTMKIRKRSLTGTNYFIVNKNTHAFTLHILLFVCLSLCKIAFTSVCSTGQT